GKIAIVTGAGSGFGEGIANTFAREGARVVVNDLNAEAGERVASAIRVAGGDAHFVQADVSNGDSVAKLLGATLARYGDLHIVVNNAGTTHKNKPLLQ
ncbi:SDR family NAD(P)-dependent oxidoreductase, partial [Escherichia fergusonii]